MKALLIIAHGTRQSDANRHLEQLTAAIESETGDRFARVKCAFLQFSKPEAGEVIAEMAAQGIRHITLLPFFLAEGGHVTSDIPNLVRKARNQYPDLVIEIKPFLGGLTGLKEVILDTV